jgi:hypothetical protein
LSEDLERITSRWVEVQEKIEGIVESAGDI